MSSRKKRKANFDIEESEQIDWSEPPLRKAKKILKIQEVSSIPDVPKKETKNINKYLFTYPVNLSNESFKRKSIWTCEKPVTTFGWKWSIIMNYNANSTKLVHDADPQNDYSPRAVTWTIQVIEPGSIPPPDRLASGHVKNAHRILFSDIEQLKTIYFPIQSYFDPKREIGVSVPSSTSLASTQTGAVVGPTPGDITIIPHTISNPALDVEGYIDEGEIITHSTAYDPQNKGSMLLKTLKVRGKSQIQRNFKTGDELVFTIGGISGSNLYVESWIQIMFFTRD